MGRRTYPLAVGIPNQLAGVGWSPHYCAQVLGVTASHVRDLCRAGQLVAIMDRRRWYIDAGSARSYLARRHVRQAREIGDRDE